MKKSLRKYEYAYELEQPTYYDIHCYVGKISLETACIQHDIIFCLLLSVE